MRLAVYHNHPSGGAARAFHELGRELARRHAIDVYTLDSADEHFWPSAGYAGQVKIAPYLPRPPRRFGLYLNDLQRHRDLDRLERVSRSVAAEIDDGQYDCVLVSACRFVQAPDVLSWLSTPSAYFCHEPPRRFLDDACRPDYRSMSAYARARALWHLPAERLIERRLQRADHRNVGAAGSVITNSRYTRDLIAGYYGRDAAVCYLGVDAERFRSDDRPRDRYVLSVGAIDRHKGFDFLVRSIARLPAATRPPLVIVANATTPGVERALRRLADRESVELDIRTRVSERELVDTYNRASVFVYAPIGEPFGLAALEAMACGLPVVAVAEGGVLETVTPGATGMLAPRSEAAFAEALSSVLASPELARALGREGRAVVEKRWTWAAAASRLEELLAQHDETVAAAAEPRPARDRRLPDVASTKQ